jgi:hypothetical protein
MYKEKYILQELCTFDHPRGCGAASYDVEFEYELNKLAKERYNELLEIYTNHDLKTSTLRLHCSKKCGFSSSDYDDFVIFKNKIKTDEFSNKYPHITFSNYRERTIDYYNGQTFEDIGKNCDYVIEGSRDDLADFYFNESNQSHADFREENPTYVEKMTKQSFLEISISCNKKNASFVRDYFTNIKKNYTDLTATINEEKSITEKNWKVKFLNNDYIFNIKLKGVRLEVESLKEILKVKQDKYKLI